jgi:uncharacterized protein YndB with AHSA1/START domain
MILATVDIAVPPTRVFEALSSKEIVNWWGSPEVYMTKEWTGDVRVGGAWRATGVDANGGTFAVAGEFLEIDPPRKLVHTWKPDWDTGTTKVTYRLDPVDGGTRVTLRHEGFGDRRDACASHGQGWQMVLGWLERSLAPKKNKARSHFLVRLLAPRPTFPVDMNEAERRIMGEHVAYWTKMLAAGSAVAFGPVMDPKGAWGLGLLELDGDAELGAIEKNDPAIVANVGFRYEVLPLMQAVTR